MKVLLTLLSYTTSVFTIVQILVPLLMCWKYYKCGTTGEEASLPLVASTLSGYIWLIYGILLGDPSVMVVNVVGGMFNVFYLLVFLVYSPSKRDVIVETAAAILLLLLVIVYCVGVGDAEVLRDKIGLLASGSTVCFFASPLIKLSHIIRCKSAACIPFPMLVITFVVSLQWLLYGLLLRNPYIIVPNVIGTTLGAFQFSLFLIYPDGELQQHDD